MQGFLLWYLHEEVAPLGIWRALHLVASSACDAGFLRRSGVRDEVEAWKQTVHVCLE
jgi:hypothetical protein